MRLRQVKFGLAIAIIGYSGMLFFSPTVGAQVNPEETTRTATNPQKALDNKAHLLDRDDDQSTRAFVDELFSFPRAFPRLPETVETLLKDRLVHAESAFRHGKNEGVREKDIVTLINGMADTIDAPPFAKTTENQIRVIRMHLILSCPLFMGKGATHPGMHVGESIADRMSPLQAVHLIHTLIDQKLINPDYQVTPEEWQGGQFARSMQRVRQLQRSKASSRGASRAPTATTHVYATKRELHDALGRAVSSLGPVDGVQVINNLFKTLKLE